MPIPKPKANEPKKEFIQRCMGNPVMVAEYSKDKRTAICTTAFETKLNTNQKISFDYDGTLSTKKGTKLAKDLITNNTLYIISARSSKTGMIDKAREVGIPFNHIFATGSNDAKIEKIKALKIQTHYDNNNDVLNQLGSVGKHI
jgi:hypothetical protein